MNDVDQAECSCQGCFFVQTRVELEVHAELTCLSVVLSTMDVVEQRNKFDKGIDCSKQENLNLAVRKIKRMCVTL